MPKQKTKPTIITHVTNIKFIITNISITVHHQCRFDRFSYKVPVISTEFSQ